MSPRLKKNRIVHAPPVVTGFNPTGCILQKETPIEIRYEEYEAFKLADYNRLSHMEASEKMEISRPTFTRIYESVRKKIAQAFVEGLPIRIVGGFVDFREEWYRCEDCYSVFSLEQGEMGNCCDCGSNQVVHLNEKISEWQQLRGHKQPVQARLEFCVCPSCETRIRHTVNKPCRVFVCPECGERMMRE